MKLIESGALATFIHAGARILESACGPCIGMGQSPKSDGISLRTFNRNFYGRSGTLSAGIYLVSPEVAAASAIQGVISDPSKLEYEDQFEKEPVIVDDSLIYAPSKDPESVEIVRGRILNRSRSIHRCRINLKKSCHQTGKQYHD